MLKFLYTLALASLAACSAKTTVETQPVNKSKRQNNKEVPTSSSAPSNTGSPDTSSSTSQVYLSPVPGGSGQVNAPVPGILATSVGLVWVKASDQDTASDQLSYQVYMSPSDNIDSVADMEANGIVALPYSQAIDAIAVVGLSAGSTYHFNIAVKDDVGNKAAYTGLEVTTSSDVAAPIPGNFSASSGETASGFTLNWQAATDNSTAASDIKYLLCSGPSLASIDTASECEAGTIEMVSAANTLTKVFTGKLPSTTYYYNVVATDLAGNKAIYPGISQSTPPDSTAPNAGTFSGSSDVSATGWTLNWAPAVDDVTAAAALQYLVCSGASTAAIDTASECEAETSEMGYAANKTSLIINGRTNGTTYYYNVIVKDVAGNKSLYNGKSQSSSSDITAPTPATLLPSTSVGDTSFTLNWAEAADSVTAGTSLQYFVCSGASLSAIDTVSECETATSEQTFATNTLSLAISGKLPNTTYYYNVVVKDIEGNKSIYPGKSQTTTADITTPSAGTFSASTSVTATGFTLNWAPASDNVTLAAGLQYFVCSGANAAAIDTISKCEAATTELAYAANVLTLATSGKAPSTTFYYNVVVKDSAGNKSLYDGKTQATAADTTAPVSGTFSASTAVAATSFTLNWAVATDNTAAAAKLSYLVCSGASLTAIDTVSECESATQEMAYTANTLTLAVAGKSPSTTYVFNVVVKDPSGNKSIYDGKSQQTTADLSAPSVGSVSASSSVTSTGFTLNWTAASDAITGTSNLEYLVCSGPNAAAVDTVSECEAATIESTYSANMTSLALSGRTPSSTSYFNIVVKDQAGNKAAYAGLTQATTADTTNPSPGSFSASTSVGEFGFTLNWSAASDNATAAASIQYLVCSSAVPTDIDSVSECESATTEMAYAANTLSLVISGRIPASTYYYNVIAKDRGGNKAPYEGKVQATTADTGAPTAGSFLASSSVAATSFTLNWSAASDNVTAAPSLQYLVCTGASLAAIDTVSECEAASSAMNYSANTLTLAVSGKIPNTTYHFNVITKDAAGNKAIYEGLTQATLSDTTAPSAGSFTATSSLTAISFTINWSTASDDITSASSLQYFVCSGASIAAIDTVSECEAASSELAYSTNTLTLAVSGKSPSTTYFYNVVVKDAVGNKSSFSGIQITTPADTAVPTAGTFSGSTGVNATGWTLNWSAASDAVTSAASLQYLVCSGASLAALDTVTECESSTIEQGYTANMISLVQTGRDNNTTYYYNVVVKDEAGNKAIYDGKSQSAASDSTAPSVGSFQASTSVGSTGFTLNWDQASDAVTAASTLQYLVCSGANAAAIDSVAECEASTQELAYTANTLTLAIASKIPSTTYYYNVIVKDSAGNKASYGGKSQTTTADNVAPSTTNSTLSVAAPSITSSGFSLQWTKSTDDVTAQASVVYEVRKSSSNNIDTVANAESNGTVIKSFTADIDSYTVSGLAHSTTYYFNVIAKDAAGNKTAYTMKSQATAGDTTAPTVGSFSASTTVGATSFTMNWAASSDDITAAASLEYFVCSGPSAASIDTVAECEAATSAMAYSANTLTLTVSGKAPTTTYYYNIVVKDATGNKAVYGGLAQTTTADTTAPTAGGFTASSSVTESTFTLNWLAASDNVTSVSSLSYFVCSGATAATIDTVAECEAANTVMAYTANTTSLAVSGKTPNTTYYYNIVVKDTAGNKSLYEGMAQAAAGDTTAPTAGTFSASTAVGVGGFTLNWSAASDTITSTTSLQYLACTGASTAAIDTTAECEAASTMAYSTNTLTLTVSGKSPSTSYYYNVVVKDAAGNKAVYNGITQTTSADVSAPTVGSFSASTSVGVSGFTLNWSAASDNVTAASSLQYLVCTGANLAAIDSIAECEAASAAMAYTANTLTLVESGKAVDTAYYYNVVVRDATGNKAIYEGKAQTTASDTTGPTAGTFSSSTSVNATSFTINWAAASDNVTAAASLQYFVCTGASISAIDTVAECEGATSAMGYTPNALNLSLSGKVPSTTYFYNVVVKDSAGNKSAYEGKSQATTADTTAPIAGSFSSSTSIGESSFTLNWTAASDNVTAAASLQYLVCTGANQAAIDTVTECEGATSAMAYAANKLSLAVTGKAPSSTYHYNVVVRDAAGNKSVYNVTSPTTTADVTAPTAGIFSSSASVSAAGFTLNWSASSDSITATASLQYLVCTGASSGALDTVSKCESASSAMAYTANTLTLTITGLTPSTTYHYNVVVRDAAGNKSLYNGLSQATTSDTTSPIASTFSASTAVGPTSFTLNWSQSSDNATATSSLVYFVCTGANAAAIDTITECEGAATAMAYTANALTLAVTGKIPSTTYYYNIVVKDAAGNKAIYDGISQATSADTTSPTAGTFSASTLVTDSTFTLNWNAATDNITAASGLSYFVCTGANAAAIDTVTECEGATTAMAYTTNTLNLAVSGKSPSMTYYYNVVVKDAAGNKSIYPGTSQTTTADATAPTIGAFSASTAVTSSGFTINWTASSDNVTAASSLVYFVCSGANAMAIDTITECEGAASVMAYTANTLTLVITGKSASTTYYYNVVVKDAADNKSIYPRVSPTTSAGSPTPTPGNAGILTSGSETTTSFVLSWTKATDTSTPQSSLQYEVRRSNSNNISTVALAETNGTIVQAYTADISSYSATGLTTSTRYYFNVIVKDTDGNKEAYSYTTFWGAEVSSPGNLDLTFASSTNGVVSQSLSSSQDRPRSIGIQSTGKILIAGHGYATSSSYTTMSVVRFNTDGSLDTSFGTSGISTIDFGGKVIDVSSVAVFSDDKIILGGTYTTGSKTSQFAVVKLTSAGALDTSFGTGGKASYSLGTKFDKAYWLNILSSGKIIQVGSTEVANGDFDFAAIRWNANGTIDTTFGTSGKTVVSFGSDADYGYASAIQSDGAIVIGGYTTQATRDVALVRLTSAGAVDTTFGTSGKVTTALGTQDDAALSVLVDSNQNIVAGGYKQVGSGIYDSVILRYNSSGVLDTGFATSGVYQLSLGGDEQLNKVIESSDGKIVGLGYATNSSNDDATAIRLTTAGALDTSFASVGYKKYALTAGNDLAYDAAIQSDGKIAVAAAVYSGSNQKFACFRIWP